MDNLNHDARCKMLIILVISSFQFIDGFSVTANTTVEKGSTTNTILKCADLIKVTCVPDAPSNPITWRVVAGSTLSTCVSAGSCAPVSPPAYPHYTFSVSVTGTDFYLEMANVKLSDDGLQLSCDDTVVTETLSIEVKEFPTDSSVVTVSDTNSNEVTVDLETNCVNIPSSEMELSWEYKDGDTDVSLKPVRQNSVVSTTCAASGDCITATSEKHMFRVFLEGSSACVSQQIRAKITVNGYTGLSPFYTGYATACIAVCDCKVLKIVWSVLFIVFSAGSGAWILYVLFAVPKARKWLTEKLCAPTHLCMIGWIFVSLLYSIIAVILYNILVCKDESSEADCWPVYVIIGIVVKGGDVAVSLLALLAFLNG